MRRTSAELISIHALSPAIWEALTAAFRAVKSLSVMGGLPIEVEEVSSRMGAVIPMDKRGLLGNSRFG
jgi:hypothetical protein